MNQPPTFAAMNIRPVRPDDTLLMQTFLQGLGDESRRHRFHGAVKACSAGLLRLMTCADGSRHVAWWWSAWQLASPGYSARHASSAAPAATRPRWRWPWPTTAAATASPTA